jgi:predicted DNA-binding transcriptional regulator AlpA
MTMKRKNREYIVDVHSTPLAAPITDEVLEDFAIGAEEERRITAPFASANLATNTLDLGAAVKASDPGAAASAGLRAFGRGLRKAHVKGAVASEVAVELDHGDGPLRQQLLSGAEVARRIGVSRQRVSQLAATSHFPKPLSSVGGYLVWRWGDIADWATLHRRRTTKPRRLGRSA